MFHSTQKRTAPASDEPTKRVNLGLVTPCLGLSDQTWIRKRARHPMLNCITLSPSVYHSGPPRHVICQELFGDTSESELTVEQQERLENEIKGRSKWRIERQGIIKAIFSTSCTLMVPRTFRYGKLVELCVSCDMLRSD